MKVIGMVCSAAPVKKGAADGASCYGRSAAAGSISSALDRWDVCVCESVCLVRDEGLYSRVRYGVRMTSE